MEMRRFSPAMLIALAGGLAASANAAFGNGANRQIQACAEPVLTPTHSPGKGKGKHARGLGGTRAYQRAAQKKRNQARHRKACRG